MESDVRKYINRLILNTLASNLRGKCINCNKEANKSYPITISLGVCNYTINVPFDLCKECANHLEKEIQKKINYVY